MNFSCEDERYMRRALRLAEAGRGFVNPNPMVGAVIVAPGGRIIGEGWHRCFGAPHAEVNAVASVSVCDSRLLGHSTIYVTLEPCSHYGKTPPCADLLASCGFRRVVVATVDPNPKVAGRGIEKLRKAGIEVETGLLEDESRRLNAAFMTAHSLGRPFITLKWACSADGFMDIDRHGHPEPYIFSTPVSSLETHQLRACNDAIAVGARTVEADTPRLDTRFMPGHSPRPVVFDRHGLISGLEDYFPGRNAIHITTNAPLSETLHKLYADDGLTSILVEGGPRLLQSFLDAGIWDAARVEVSPRRLAEKGRAQAPVLTAMPFRTKILEPNSIFYYSNNPLVGTWSPIC